jgi:GT2 family glycosyltransferase
MDCHPDVGIATGKVLHSDMTYQWSFAMFPNYMSAAFNHTVRLIKGLDIPLRKRVFHKRYDLSRQQDVDWVTGAYLFLRKALLADGKVFDEDVYMFYEDTLLCRRVHGLGYRVVYLPYGAIIHYGRMSTRQVQSRSVLESFKSSVIYFEKVYGRASSRFYQNAVITIWRGIALVFFLLRIVPLSKFRKKAELFRYLLAHTVNT